MKMKILLATAAILAASTAYTTAAWAQAAPEAASTEVTDSSAGSELMGLTCEDLNAMDEGSVASFLQGYEAGYRDAGDPEPAGQQPGAAEANTNPTTTDAQPATSAGSDAVAGLPPPAAPADSAAPAAGAAPATAETAPTLPAAPAAPAGEPAAAATGGGQLPPGPSSEGTPAPTTPPEAVQATPGAETASSEAVPSVHPMVAACMTGPDQTLAQAFANRYGFADAEDASKQQEAIPEPSSPAAVTPGGAAPATPAPATP